MKAIGIGIAGVGTVGSGVVQALTEHASLLETRSGAPLRIVKVAVRSRPRVDVPPDVITHDVMELARDPRVDIVVELIGGTDTARELVLAALENGKHVVTANKALLAMHGREIYAAAAARRLDLGFEASVCGAIPILRSIREGLIGNAVTSIAGIVNGTSNYILSQMSDGGRPYDDVLAEAQAAGYAEADPTLDVDGSDAAHKLQILASVAFRGFVPFESVHVEGIAGIDPRDIAFARDLGCRIKLLAIARVEDGELELRVHPTLIPESHPLASVNGVQNAVHVVGDFSGPLVFSGLGAGQRPTASSVVADIVEIAHNLVFLRPSRVSLLPTAPIDSIAGVRPIGRIRTRYYLRVMALDQPGVLAAVSGVLAANGVSIASMIQKGRAMDTAVPIVMVTHTATEAAVRRALTEIDALDQIAAPSVCLRVEGLPD